MSLTEARIGFTLRIAHIELDDERAAWLSAIGLFRGEELTVLRRAAFGGPLHVRTAAGGEFAVALELASNIAVQGQAA